MGYRLGCSREGCGGNARDDLMRDSGKVAAFVVHPSTSQTLKSARWPSALVWMSDAARPKHAEKAVLAAQGRRVRGFSVWAWDAGFLCWVLPGMLPVLVTVLLVRLE